MKTPCLTLTAIPDMARILGYDYPTDTQHASLMLDTLRKEVMDICRVNHPNLRIRVKTTAEPLSDADEEITGTLRDLLLSEMNSQSARLKQVLLAMVPKTDMLEFVDFDELVKGLNVRMFSVNEHEQSSLRLYPVNEISQLLSGDPTDMHTLKKRIQTLPKDCWVKVFR